MSCVLLTTLVAQLALAQADGGLSPGWFVSGATGDYQISTVTPGRCDARAVNVTSVGAPRGPVAVLQTFRAETWKGARVRYEATVDTRALNGWAGLFLRVETSDKKTLTYDDLHSRPLRGTTPCEPGEAVLDVPADAEWISLGVRLEGSGSVELSEVKFEKSSTERPLSTETNGQVGGAYFTDTMVGANLGNDARLRLTLRQPGVFADAAGDGQARVDGPEVEVRLLDLSGPTALSLTGRFRLAHAEGTTTITGTWGTAVRRYPVTIHASATAIDFKWGEVERRLTVAPEAQRLRPGCRLFSGKESQVKTDELEVCGAALSPTAPTVQTVVAFLLAGFRSSPRTPGSPVPDWVK